MHRGSTPLVLVIPGLLLFITFLYVGFLHPPPPLLLTAFYHSEYLCPSIYGIQCEGIRWLVLGFFFVFVRGWFSRLVW